MIKQIVGGVAVLVIGGTTFAVSQSDVIDNFSKETGMSHQQAEDYVNNSQKNLASFSIVGQDFIDEGNSISKTAASIDCVNYTYEWESSALDCWSGKNQLTTIGNNETLLGNCYKSLDTDLGNTATSKINECIQDIDTVNSDYNYPIVSSLLDSATITQSRQTNSYNKSVLKAALQAKN